MSNPLLNENFGLKEQISNIKDRIWTIEDKNALRISRLEKALELAICKLRMYAPVFFSKEELDALDHIRINAEQFQFDAVEIITRSLRKICNDKVAQGEASIASEKFVTQEPLPTDHEREIIVCMIEEAGETIDELSRTLATVIKRATKMLRFGVHEVQVGQDKDNVHRLSTEIGDLYALIDRATTLGLINISTIVEARKAKEEKLKKYLQTVSPTVGDITILDTKLPEEKKNVASVTMLTTIDWDKRLRTLQQGYRAEIIGESEKHDSYLVLIHQPEKNASKIHMNYDKNSGLPITIAHPSSLEYRNLLLENAHIDWQKPLRCMRVGTTIAELEQIEDGLAYVRIHRTPYAFEVQEYSVHTGIHCRRDLKYELINVEEECIDWTRRLKTYAGRDCVRVGKLLKKDTEFCHIIVDSKGNESYCNKYGFNAKYIKLAQCVLPNAQELKQSFVTKDLDFYWVVQRIVTTFGRNAVIRNVVNNLSEYVSISDSMFDRLDYIRTQNGSYPLLAKYNLPKTETEFFQNKNHVWVIEDEAKQA